MHEWANAMNISILEKQIKQMKQELPEQLREAFLDGATTALKSLREDNEQYGIIPSNKKDFKEFLRKRYPDYKE